MTTATLPRLPALTDDVERATADLAELGIARIADALTPDEVSALKERLIEQAAAEAATGVAFFDGGDGANQRGWNLPSKGQVFRDLLAPPVVRPYARHILEGDYCLSSYT